MTASGTFALGFVEVSSPRLLYLDKSTPSTYSLTFFLTVSDESEYCYTSLVFIKFYRWKRITVGTGATHSLDDQSFVF
jgi:hypothetical protein